MRIVIVCPYDMSVYGGVQNQVQLLASAYLKRNHNVALCYVGSFNEQSYKFDVLIKAGNTLKVPVNGSVAPVSFDFLSMSKALKEIENFKPDVLHIHEPFAPSISYLLLIKKQFPIVATFHRYGSDYIYKIASFALRPLAKKIDHACFVSGYAFKTANELFSISGSILFNAVDLSEFNNLKINKKDSSYVDVLFFGRHEPRKGLSILLEAFSEINENARLKIIGQGNQTQFLKERFSKLKNVIWCGALSRKDLIKELYLADIVVIPSLKGESFGLSLLEALAAGNAVIASNLESYREVAGSSALYFDPGNVKELKTLLIELINDHNLRQEISLRASQRARLYDINVLTQRYEAIFKSLLK